MVGASTGRGALGGARVEPVEAMWAEPAQPEWVGRVGGRSQKFRVELWDWGGAMGGAASRGRGPFPSTSLSTSRILFVAPGLAPEPNPSLWEVVFQIQGASTTPPEGTQGSVSSSPGSPPIIQIRL